MNKNALSSQVKQTYNFLSCDFSNTNMVQFKVPFNYGIDQSSKTKHRHQLNLYDLIILNEHVQNIDNG